MDDEYIEIIKYKQSLLTEFDNKCAYCGCQIDLPNLGVIDLFYPKDIYPEKAHDKDNLILSCEICNSIKSNKFP